MDSIMPFALPILSSRLPFSWPLGKLLPSGRQLMLWLLGPLSMLIHALISPSLIYFGLRLFLSLLDLSSLRF